MKFNRLFGILAIAILLPTTHPARSIDSQSGRSAPILQNDLISSLSGNICQPSDDGTRAPTVEAIKKTAEAVTMRITSANHGGSGVLIAKKGNTYLVLTNQHVVGRDTQFQVRTPDGQKHTAKLLPNTQINPKYDITLLQFTSSANYEVAPLQYPTGESITPLSETRTIYTTGFPFDSDKLRFSQGKVSQLSDVPLDDGTQIGYTTDKGEQELRQGMSGGPIIDGCGFVIGINTIGSYPILPNYTYFDGSRPTAKRATGYRAANWGVPVHNLLTQLNSNILYGYQNFPKVQRQVTPTGYLAKLNRETRQQTVRIEDSAGNGSGVIIAKQGNTYYVLTAKHVVETPATDTQPKQSHTGIKAIAHDQEIYQIQPSDINLADGADLAIVKFTSNTNYPVAKLGNYSPLANTTVFAAGYPARGKIDSPLWQWQLNPGSIQEQEQGKMQTQDKLSFANGYDLIYTSISYGGMSGGPVFDTEGRVIGIHGKAEGEKRDGKDLILGQSLGISIQTLLGLKELKLPNTLDIDARQARTLTQPEQQTVDVVLENIAEPQADSDGSQWLQYGNQLYRIRQSAKAAVAFDKAIARDRQYKLLGNYGKALALNNQAALTAINAAILAVNPIEKRRYYYLWKQQSVIFRTLGKYDEALAAIDMAITFEPNDLILLNEKAGIFIKKKQYSAAIAIFNSIIIKQPQDTYAYVNRGVAKFESGQKQAAITDYDSAIAINPNLAQAYANRGVAKSTLGQKQAAITDYDRAIAINPNLAEAYISRGNAKSALGQKQAAITDYDRAIAINPNLAEAYYNRGNAKSALGQKQAAITDFDSAIAIDPNYADAYTNRGLAKSALGQNQAAITDYDRAIDITPNLAQAYYNRGLAKYNLGQNQAAIADYDRAIAIDPNDADAYNNRGGAKSALGQKQAAITDYDRAIALNPNNADAYNNRGNAKANLGQKQASVTDYDRAIAINPNYAEAYYNRGNTRYELGQKQAAITDYDRAIAIDPNKAQAYYNRGIAKAELGQKQAAITDYDRAIAIDPNKALAYYNRGSVKSDLGQKQAAIIDLTTAAELLRQQGRMDLYEYVIREIKTIKG
ncbi:MAG: tetratricopeptide repeat protein [Chamaesiphon sp.]|nr:tetratricopeptide repeat protein [Chamaesiphon sp.]